MLHTLAVNKHTIIVYFYIIVCILSDAGVLSRFFVRVVPLFRSPMLTSMSMLVPKLDVTTQRHAIIFVMSLCQDASIPILTIRLELMEKKVALRPPLDESSSQECVQETVQHWLDSFLARGSLVHMLGGKVWCCCYLDREIDRETDVRMDGRMDRQTDQCIWQC